MAGPVLLLLLSLLASYGATEAEFECVTSCDVEGVSLGVAGSEARCCRRPGAGGLRSQGSCRPCQDSGLLQPYSQYAEAEEFAGSGDQCGVLECGPLATCQTVAGALRCVCRPGYTGDAPNCTDINECAGGNHSCDERGYLRLGRRGLTLIYEKRGLCTNTEGSFYCSCRQGFTLEESTCTDINECLNEPSLCAANAECYNLLGSHYCQCKVGFVGDGGICCVSQEDLWQFRNRGVCERRRRGRKRTKQKVGSRDRLNSGRRRHSRSDSDRATTRSPSSRTSTTRRNTGTGTSHETHNTRSSLTRGCERYLRRYHGRMTCS